MNSSWILHLNPHTNFYFVSAMIALFVLSKVVIIKAATFFFFLAFFQKLFSVGGVLLTYLMKNQLAVPAPPAPSPAPAPSAGPPSTSYGSPIDYNTIGYSYGPPDHEAAFEGPSLADFGGPFNWILQKPWLSRVFERLSDAMPFKYIRVFKDFFSNFEWQLFVLDLG